MISAWWLLLIIPAIGFGGFLFGALLAEKGHQDDCSDCQYNSMNYSKNKEKSE
jgi:hypothetical protein